MNKTLTRQTKVNQNVTKKWYVIDAKGKVLGRLASVAAEILLGKGKATFTPNQDSGDHVVIINAHDIHLTGRKEARVYYRHSGYPGGLKGEKLSNLREENSDRIIRTAVRGMLPKSRLGSVIIKKLHVTGGTEHGFSDKELIEVKIR